MRFQSYFNTAIKIIQLYDGAIPLQHFLKNYFSQHKKHGSTDRKAITNACYNFYRLGKSFIELSIEKKLSIAIFICNDDITDWKFLFDGEWIQHHSNSLQQRINFIQNKFSFFKLNDVFPFTNELSENINVHDFSKSFFIQPDVFIRIRPGYYETVSKKLQQANIQFNIVNKDCIALSPAAKVNTIIKPDEEAVIQDYSSQRVKVFLELFKLKFYNSKLPISVWDCCAGSGGKSILANDILQNINLMVSDIRPSIIQNLKQRFAKAGIKNYKSFVADVSNSKQKTGNLKPDLIICDAPCTGSGTWSRAPEQLYFFNEKKIEHYTLLQKRIVSNAILLLQQNGYFLYITCSVFTQENEDIVNFIKQQFHLELIKMELLRGYNDKADTMFAALFEKKL